MFLAPVEYISSTTSHPISSAISDQASSTNDIEIPKAVKRKGRARGKHIIVTSSNPNWALRWLQLQTIKTQMQQKKLLQNRQFICFVIEFKNIHS